MSESIDRRDINGVPVNVTCKRELFVQLDQLFIEPSAKPCRSVFFLNAHCYNLAIADSEYCKVLTESDYVLNDGIGVSIAGKLKGIKFRENLVGTDLIPDYLEHIHQRDLKVFFYGSRPGVVDDLLKKYNSKGWNLKLAGAHGYIGHPEEGKVVDIINAFKPDVLVLGLGVPLQEKWASKYRKMLSTTKVIFAGGAIIDNMSDSIPRAPLWMRKLKSEWIFRLYLEPKRLASRYFLGIPLFFWYILTGQRPKLVDQTKKRSIRRRD
jgi:N-acetylglucosaminyldiphosphoundecaprenol N-acetyl-beta-D-mannosaminyltransferase